jgi:hypothetical protein
LEVYQSHRSAGFLALANCHLIHLGRGGLGMLVLRDKSRPSLMAVALWLMSERLERAALRPTRQSIECYSLLDFGSRTK